MATVFLLAGTLLTAAVTMAPTAYAEGDDDRKKKYSVENDGNKVKTEGDSNAGLNDCDYNDVKYASKVVCKTVGGLPGPEEPEEPAGPDKSFDTVQRSGPPTTIQRGAGEAEASCNAGEEVTGGSFTIFQALKGGVGNLF